MASFIVYLHTLAGAVLVGKVVLLSFVVAPILAKNLEREPFGKVVRQLFPAYHGLGMGTAVAGFIAVSGLIAFYGSSATLLTTGGMWLLVLLAEAYCRSTLTPQSNAIRDRLKEQQSLGAVDRGLQTAWNRLHQRSVSLNSMVLLIGCILIALVR
ncbi:DUF4149 domain-containing protein [Nitrospira sp. Nam74]